MRRSIFPQVHARYDPDGTSGGGAASGEEENRLEGVGGQDGHGDNLCPRVPDALALHRLPARLRGKRRRQLPTSGLYPRIILSVLTSFSCVF